MFNIVDINIETSVQTFIDKVEEHFSNVNSNTGDDYKIEYKTAKLSRSGSTMCKFTLEHVDNGNTIVIVAEVNTSSKDKIIFKPFALSNYNASFYKMDCNGDKETALEEALLNALSECAKKNKGKLAYIYMSADSMSTVLIVDGVYKTAKGIGIVDMYGKFHTLSSEEVDIDTNDDEDDNVTSYVPKYLINDWLDENLEFRQKINNLSQREQFEMMAQFAIYQKRKNMITASQFKDILIQTGTFIEMTGGFKDPNVQNIYQLVV